MKNRHAPASRQRTWWRATLALAACGFALRASAATAERITFTEISSRALGRALPLAFVAPDRPPSGGAAPVLFFLHGRGRTCRSLIDSPAARAALLAAPFYVVLPQGEDGWYVDSPAQPAERYGTYLGEVIAWAEDHLPISRASARTGIAGWSMGGYGAVRYAETHPGRFGFVASVIGLLDYPRPETLPDGQNYHVAPAHFTADPAIWEQFNPIRGIAALRGTALTLVLAAQGFDRTMNENFLAALAAEKLRARVHRLEGRHEFSVVEQAVPLVLADATDFFAQPSASP
jgi:S-formylglutathione hydrolase FrmB